MSECVCAREKERRRKELESYDAAGVVCLTMGTPFAVT